MVFAAANKVVLGESGLMDAVATALQQPNVPPPIRFLCIGIIRSLCRDNGNHQSLVSINFKAANSERLMQSPLLSLVLEQTASSDEGIKAESTRILINLVKLNTTWCDDIAKLGAIGPMVDMLTSKHAVLQLEASVALFVLFANTSTQHRLFDNHFRRLCRTR